MQNTMVCGGGGAPLRKNEKEKEIYIKKTGKKALKFIFKGYKIKQISRGVFQHYPRQPQIFCR